MWATFSLNAFILCFSIFYEPMVILVFIVLKYNLQSGKTLYVFVFQLLLLECVFKKAIKYSPFTSSDSPGKINLSKVGREFCS